VLTAGEKIGSYEIVSSLGAGGMGEVYRARDTKLQRDVALKILPETMARDAQRMARFEREAQVLASLNHPNIAAIYGLEESNGIRALVMELVEGQTLAERISVAPGFSPASVGCKSGATMGQGRSGIGEGSALPREPKGLPYEETLPISKQIAEALEYAHERGVIHRDLKPANVKITPEGTVKVLDFGLAKVLDTQDSTATMDMANSPTLSAMATQAGMILGTAAYMSPEQAKGQRVDRRADIWAFGCVMYEMLTGRKPFEGETISDVLAAVIRAEPDWTAIPETTPQAIKKLVYRCLQKDQRQRLQAIGEARITIEETLSGSASITSPLLPGEGGPEERDRVRVSPLRRALPWAAGLVVGALVSGLVVWKLAARAPQSAMHFSAVTNFAGVQAEPAISPDGRSVAFVSNRDRSFIIYLGMVHGGNLVQITNGPNLESAPSWSPDGTTLAYARLNRWGTWDVWEVPALGGTPRRVILDAADPTWSPDGRSLAYFNLDDGGIWISGTSGENTRQAVRPWSAVDWDTQPRISPDGRKIVFAERVAEAGPYGELAVADVASGKIRQLTHDGALALSPTWSPDGKFIYFASSRGGTINIWKIAADGGEPEQITAGEGDDADLDLSKDGKEIVFGTLRQKIGLAQLDLQAKPGQQSVKNLTNDPARSQFGPTYSPDGKHLAYFSNLKGAEKEAIWISDADGSNAAPLVQDALINIFPAWSPNSKSIIYSSEHGNALLQQWEIRQVSLTGGAPQTLFNQGIYVDVGRDGRVLFQGPQSQAEAFEPRDGKTQTLGTLHGATWSFLRWSPDEQSVAYIMSPSKADDPNAGLWAEDFKNPPRQLFKGWVLWFARGPGNEIYFLEGKPDMSSVLWKVDWDGQRLKQTSWTVPILYNLGYYHTELEIQFDVSPDGRYLAFQTEKVLEANIGMIENVR
jgi:eukaryotic-like serine/threonine-protein kinase